MDGFSGTVNLACDSSSVPKSSCSVTPTSLNVNGAPAPFTVMVTTMSNARAIPLGPFSLLKRFTLYRSWPALLLALLVGLSLLALAASRRRLAWGAALAMLLLLSLGGCGAIGSGGGGGKGTPPSTYTVTVTTSVEGVNRPLKLTLTVN